MYKSLTVQIVAGFSIAITNMWSLLCVSSLTWYHLVWQLRPQLSAMKPAHNTIVNPGCPSRTLEAYRQNLLVFFLSHKRLEDRLIETQAQAWIYPLQLLNTSAVSSIKDKVGLLFRGRMCWQRQVEGVDLHSVKSPHSAAMKHLWTSISLLCSLFHSQPLSSPFFFFFFFPSFFCCTLSALLPHVLSACLTLSAAHIHTPASNRFLSLARSWCVRASLVCVFWESLFNNTSRANLLALSPLCLQVNVCAARKETHKLTEEAFMPVCSTFFQPLYRLQCRSVYV